jgi:hypothetical protein
MAKRHELSFQAHQVFKKADIDERQQLAQSICEVIWAKLSAPE